MEIKEWILQARKDAELTQTQLGDLLGVTKANVSGWENGRHEPNLSQIRKISAICKAQIQLLFKGLGDTTSIWPFSVDYKSFEGLPDDKKSEIDTYISYVFERWQSTKDKAPLPDSDRTRGKTSALDRNSFYIDDQSNEQKKQG